MQRLGPDIHMQTTHQITEIVFEAIDEVNQLLPRDRRIPKSEDAMLFGPSGLLDSMGVVNLSVAVEEKVEKKFGVSVSLIGDEAMGEEVFPMESVQSLIGYLAKSIKKD